MIRLTPEALARGYDYLREFAPFKGWRLPDSDDVEFHVIRDPRFYADCVMDGSTFVIRVSEGKNGLHSTLLPTLAHEMVHCRQFMLGDTANHNALFRKLARTICATHGWDVRCF